MVRDQGPWSNLAARPNQCRTEAVAVPLVFMSTTVRRATKQDKTRYTDMYIYIYNTIYVWPDLNGTTARLVCPAQLASPTVFFVCGVSRRVGTCIAYRLNAYVSENLSAT